MYLALWEHLVPSPAASGSILFDILWLGFDHNVFFQSGVKVEVNIWSEHLCIYSHLGL